MQAAHQQTGFESEGRHNLFSIKPYKNNLLTPGANYWIICIHLVILVMATSEAIAWGYLGSLFGKGALGYTAAAITFIFMFLIIWVIDVSFVTLDLSRSYYDKIILKKESERWVDNTRLGIGLLGRVTIVFVSLSISAPFLAQIVFKQDIDNEINRRNMATVSMVSDSMLIAKDEEVAALDSMILVREAELITETAGKGSSGNYGFGPVTRAMENNLERLRGERAVLLQDKAVMDQTAQSLTVDEFASLHNVDLINNGVRTREEILGGLMENPEYRTAKTAITAFLAFIFAALVLLKLFQPRSVRIYYNEKLQDLYREYLAGHLNKWISTPEQSMEGKSQMSPLRFEDWCVNTYSVVRNEDIKRRDSRKIYNLFKMKIEQLEEEKAEIKKMMEPVEREFEQAMTEVNQIKIELLEVENELEYNIRNGDEIARQLENISDDLRHNRFQGSDVLIAVTAKKEAEDKLALNKNERLALQYKHDLIRHRFDVKDADVKQVEALVAKIRMNYRDLQEKIDRERIAYTDLVVSGQVVDIPRTQVEINPVEKLLTNRTREDRFEDRDENIEEPAVNGHLPWENEPAAEQVDLMYDEGYNESPEDKQLPEEDIVAELTEEELLEEEGSFEEDVADQEVPFGEDMAEEKVIMQWDFEDESLNEDEEEVVDWNDDVSEEAVVMSSDLPGKDEVETVSTESTGGSEPRVFIPEEESEVDSPIEFVDDQQLKAYAEAVSLANYEEEERKEAVPDTDEKVAANYFVDPALIAYNSYDSNGVDASLDEAEDVVSSEPESIDKFNEDVQLFLEAEEDTMPSGEKFAEEEALIEEAGLEGVELEEEEDDDSLEEDILKKITNRGNRTDRNGRPIRKGTFGKTFGEGV